MTTFKEAANGQAVEADTEPPDEAVALFGFGHTTPVPHNTVTNGDEQLDFGGAKYIGNFHKTLPRRANGTGEVDPSSYIAFANICDLGGDYEFTPASPGASKLINPQAGRATEQIGPDPTSIHMLPAPSVVSDSTAAEMVELYWMAKVRDVNFHDYGGNGDVANAITDIKKAYKTALESPTHTVGDLRLGLDLPSNSAGTAVKINAPDCVQGGAARRGQGPVGQSVLLAGHQLRNTAHQGHAGALQVRAELSDQLRRLADGTSNRPRRRRQRLSERQQLFGGQRRHLLRARHQAAADPDHAGSRPVRQPGCAAPGVFQRCPATGESERQGRPRQSLRAVRAAGAFRNHGRPALAGAGFRSRFARTARRMAAEVDTSAAASRGLRRTAARAGDRREWHTTNVWSAHLAVRRLPFAHR